MNSLFEPRDLARRTLRNRFVMTPMTGARAKVGEAEPRPED
ncbi:hypothetical protein [Sinorhizobium meliloti]|nr:hypothetical protein [Sinorhizobium meliloti]